MSLPLHERLTLTEAEHIGRQFVQWMRECDRGQRSDASLRVCLVSLFDDAREWGGEKVKQRRASIGARYGQGVRNAA